MEKRWLASLLENEKKKKKNGGIAVKVFENNRIRRERNSKGKRAENKARKHDQEGGNFLE